MKKRPKQWGIGQYIRSKVLLDKQNKGKLTERERDELAGLLHAYHNHQASSYLDVAPRKAVFA